MKKLILGAALFAATIASASAQTTIDSGVLWDGQSVKIAVTKEIASLSYAPAPWMGKLGIESAWLVGVAAMQPDSGAELYTGLGVDVWLRKTGDVQFTLGFGFTSNILRQSIDSTQAIWYVKVGMRVISF
jgi:hypothetical protein